MPTSIKRSSGCSPSLLYTMLCVGIWLGGGVSPAACVFRVPHPKCLYGAVAKAW